MLEVRGYEGVPATVVGVPVESSNGKEGALVDAPPILPGRVIAVPSPPPHRQCSGRKVCFCLFLGGGILLVAGLGLGFFLRPAIVNSDKEGGDPESDTGFFTFTTSTTNAPPYWCTDPQRHDRLEEFRGAIQAEPCHEPQALKIFLADWEALSAASIAEMLLFLRHVADEIETDVLRPSGTGQGSQARSILAQLPNELNNIHTLVTLDTGTLSHIDFRVSDDDHMSIRSTLSNCTAVVAVYLQLMQAHPELYFQNTEQTLGVILEQMEVSDLIGAFENHLASLLRNSISRREPTRYSPLEGAALSLLVTLRSFSFYHERVIAIIEALNANELSPYARRYLHLEAGR